MLENKKLFRLAFFACCLAAVVVMLGAWTRLVDAGLGCPDWPGCYGFLVVPEHPEDIALAELRFPDSPVESAKGWPEMIHRYFASTLGLVIMAICGLAFWQKKQQKPGQTPMPVPLKHCLGLLVLVICQGLFGMWTVTLKLWPQVVSAHLLGGFATLSLLALLALRTRATTAIQEAVSSKALRVIKTLAVWGLIAAVVQIFLGAWTASNYAALACGTEFPGCQSSLWPEMNFAGGFNFLQAIGPNYLGGLFDNASRVAIHYTHRIGALLLTLLLSGLIIYGFRQLRHQQLRRALSLLATLLLVQVLLGISNVIWLVPLAVAVAHNAVGALLLISLVNINYQLARIEQQATGD